MDKPFCQPDSPAALPAFRTYADRVGCALALVEVEPSLQLTWIHPGHLLDAFGTAPDPQALFSAARVADQERLADFWQHVHAHESPMMEVQLRRADGTQHWYRFHAVCQPDVNGTETIVLSIANIEGLVAGEARKIEQRRKETIQSMSAGIAHEFNNALTPIRGFIELTLDMLEPDHPTLDGLKTALTQAEACADLVKQIMFTSSKSILNLRKVSLATLLSNILYDLAQSPLLRGDRIALEEHIAPDLPEIWIDHEVFRESIHHLVRNAVTAMPEGGTLSVSAQTADIDAISSHGNKGDFVLISIRDTGSGISPEHMGKIFDPFFTTGNRAESRGMGLPMVQGLVNQMGGWIQIQSAPGEGTRVLVYLPVTPPGKKERSAPLQDKDGTLSISGGTAGTILVADDETYVLKLMTRVFDKEGWRVVEAKSFYEALNVIEKAPGFFDALILDVSMSGPGAEEAILRIREVGCKAQILLVSGLPNNKRIQNLVKLSGGTFVSKPFSLGGLVEKVEQMTRGARSPV